MITCHSEEGDMKKRTLKDLMMEHPITTLRLAIRTAKDQYSDYVSKDPAEKIRILETILHQ